MGGRRPRTAGARTPLCPRTDPGSPTVRRTVWSIRSRACCGWARIPTALARRTSRLDLSPNDSRLSATRWMDASNQIALDAWVRLWIDLTPWSFDWLNQTPWASSAAATSAAAPSGPAAMIAAWTIASRRANETAWAHLATRRSTTSATSTDTWRVLSAVLRASHGRTSPATGILQHRAELGGSELGDRRCAGTAEAHQSLRPRKGPAGSCLVEVTVQVRPLRRGLKHRDLGAVRHFTCLSRGRQRGGCVQSAEVEVEHSSTLDRTTDSSSSSFSCPQGNGENLRRGVALPGDRGNRA